jgi:bacterioferritin
MDAGHLIFRLKEFYILEMYQLELYKSQIPSLENEYIRHAYERMVELEQHHVDFYAHIIAEHNEKVPVITGGLSSLAARFSGEAIDLTSAENRYKLGAAVENKAIEMYRAFIMEAWEHPELVKKLWHNMIDEELHLLWFKDNQKHATSLVKST